MPFSLVLQKLSSFYASSEIFNIVLFMVSYIVRPTRYSILLFMNPLNFKFLQLCQRFLTIKKRKKTLFTSMPKTVTRQRRGCDLNPGNTAPESNTLTTRLPSYRKSTKSAHQEVEDAEAEHGERDTDVSVVVEEVEHPNAQTTPATHNKQPPVVVIL